MKKIGWALILVSIAILFSNCTTPEDWEINQWYTQLSRYKGHDTRAYSVYLKVMEEEKIQKICDKYLKAHKDKDRFLQVDFYDQRDFTPDYTDGIEVNKYQAEHKVAQFYYDPFNEKERLEFY